MSSILTNWSSTCSSMIRPARTRFRAGREKVLQLNCSESSDGDWSALSAPIGGERVCLIWMLNFELIKELLRKKRKDTVFERIFLGRLKR
ncbi:hypothetical protein TNCV_4128511 [Trichonephila clavipes]|nr:hypothetical protein TNCV_4128511 [Trichonephila clavipes]